MQPSPVILPVRPTPRTLAFDEAAYINGYNASDMDGYATAAVLHDRQARASWVRRLIQQIKGASNEQHRPG